MADTTIQAINYTELTKLYYSIGEVSEMFKVSTSLLRYWETEFTMLRPQKNRKGDRKYTKKDIQKVEQIYDLVKKRGFTLSGAKKELKKKTAPSPNETIKAKLRKIRQGLETIKMELS